MTEKQAYLSDRDRSYHGSTEILIPEAKYDGKVEVMDSFWTSAYQKVNKVGNLRGQYH